MSTYQHKRVQSAHPFIKVHIAVKPTKTTGNQTRSAPSPMLRIWDHRQRELLAQSYERDGASAEITLNRIRIRCGELSVLK